MNHHGEHGCIKISIQVLVTCRALELKYSGYTCHDAFRRSYPSLKVITLNYYPHNFKTPNLIPQLLC